MSGIKDRIIEYSLMIGIVACIGALALVLRMMLVHILCGILFMGVAGYTLVQGQEARTRAQKLLWFVCTGAVIFLFSYWALQVVFRPPKIKETIGCGGVKFVDKNGNIISEDGNIDRPGGLRTEL